MIPPALHYRMEYIARTLDPYTPEGDPDVDDDGDGCGIGYEYGTYYAGENIPGNGHGGGARYGTWVNEQTLGPDGTGVGDPPPIHDSLSHLAGFLAKPYPARAGRLQLAACDAALMAGEPRAAWELLFREDDEP